MKNTSNEARKKYPEETPLIAKVPHRALLLLHKDISADINWAMSDDLPFLLGRRHVFSHFTVTFKEKDQKIFFQENQ